MVGVASAADENSRHHNVPGTNNHTLVVHAIRYDTETLNLRDVLNRAPPITADAGDDPTDQISPKGPISQDINGLSAKTYTVVVTDLNTFCTATLFRILGNPPDRKSVV